MKHNISSIERKYSVEDDSSMLLIELKSGITFFVDLWHEFDIDIDPENGTHEERVEITDLKVYDKYRKPAFRWNKIVEEQFYDDIERFLLIELKNDK